MKGRFADFVWVRLKPGILRGVGPWPPPGQQLTIICNEHKELDLPPLYLCEWDVAGKKPQQRYSAGKKPQQRYSEDQLEPWPGLHRQRKET